jgi:ketosteroid isomerase-like protein
MADHTRLIAKLQDRFRAISALLYDTSIDTLRVDAEMAPLLADDVTFTDPWQTGTGKANYRLGAAGFHAMFKFELDIHQVGVQLSDDGATGRAIVEGVMKLRPLGKLFMYPLRTILIYDFAVTDAQAAVPGVQIRAHEEMWSIADMITALPLTGWVYRHAFRPAFSRGFLAASWLTARARGMLPDIHAR